MNWDAVRHWRDHVRTIDVDSFPHGLSSTGARAALDVALDALDDTSLSTVAAMEGRPWPRVALVTARTVFTAPIEWVAILLGRGSTVDLKHPTGFPGIAPELARIASQQNLPLSVTESRNVLSTADLIVAMGSDDTVASLHADAGHNLLAFGHRFSAVWMTDPTSAAGIAADAALHDGRGCLSPTWILSPLPPETAIQALAQHLANAETRWPRGIVHDTEAAAIRARSALARVTGSVHEGTGWAIHHLPVAHVQPMGLPRTILLTTVPSVQHALVALEPWRQWLSTIAADANQRAWRNWGALRVCLPGELQRPPLLRLHDGVDWLRATLQPPSGHTA